MDYMKTSTVIMLECKAEPMAQLHCPVSSVGSQHVVHASRTLMESAADAYRKHMPTSPS